ncbi:hypothetical protein BFP77_08210 [Maribacter sp. 4U21]|uniref:hypothetical protein n=1 Tax=Maribacter sp. 4U21 TaxID=1889779 RepID=UPI000C15D51E|nr:hypothetical protein [Maribacter sp. 4U21]PIB28890.1 hypothetical protein BFP77_08210 [Maribacter sp. 4U21]
MKNQEQKDYVIKKRNFGYWYLDDRGYTKEIKYAKRFTEAEATEIVNRPNSDKTMHLYREELFKPKTDYNPLVQ